MIRIDGDGGLREWAEQHTDRTFQLHSRHDVLPERPRYLQVQDRPGQRPAHVAGQSLAWMHLCALCAALNTNIYLPQCCLHHAGVRGSCKSSITCGRGSREQSRCEEEVQRRDEYRTEHLREISARDGATGANTWRIKRQTLYNQSS